MTDTLVPLNQPLPLNQELCRTSVHDPYAVSVLTTALRNHFRSVLSPVTPVVIICIGTDRSTGDAFGPLIGSKLSPYKLPGVTLFGTLEQPVHAVNLAETMDYLSRNFHSPYVVAVDACLGHLDSVGHITIDTGPLIPGAAMKKNLPPVGNLSIKGIVNVSGFLEYFVLQNTRLSLVMQMADTVARSLYLSLLNFQQVASSLS